MLPFDRVIRIDGEYETQLYGLLSTKADKGKAYVNVFDFGPVSGVLTS